MDEHNNFLDNDIQVEKSLKGYRSGIRFAKICALSIPSILAITTFIWQIYTFYWQKSYTETLIKGVGENTSADIVEKLYSLLENNAYNSLELILAIVGIAVSVWVGLNIYNALDRKELDSFADEIKVELNTELAKISHSQSKNILEAINEMKDNSNIQLLLTNMLSIFSVDKASEHYIDYFSNVSISNWNVKTIKTIIKVENVLSKIHKLTSEQKYDSISELIDSVENELINSEEFFKNIDKTAYGYYHYKLGELSYYKGNSFYQRRQKNEIAKSLFRKAIDHYTSASKLDTELKSIENGIGISYLRLVELGDNVDNKNINEAIKNFEMVLEKRPYFTQAIRSLGSSYEKVGRLDDAIAQYNNESRIEPNSFFAHTCLASAYLKKIDAEIHFLNRTEVYEPLNNAFDEEQIERFEKLLKLADEELQTAHRINPSRVDVYYRFGQIYTFKIIMLHNFGLKNKDKKIEDLIEAAKKEFYICDKLLPNNHSVKVHERNFYEVIGDIKKANEINKTLISKDQELRNNIYHNYFN